MKVEAKLTELGLAVPDLESLYRTNASGAHYISHYPVQNLLYLSGTTPRRDGRGYLPGVVGKDLTLEQGYEAARYAALTTLAAVKYALGELDRVQQIVAPAGLRQLGAGLQRSAPGDQRGRRPAGPAVRRAGQADARRHRLSGPGRQRVSGDRRDAAVQRQRGAPTAGARSLREVGLRPHRRRWRRGP